MRTESGVRARSDNPRSRGPAPDFRRAQLPPRRKRRPRPAVTTKHFMDPRWAAVHTDFRTPPLDAHPKQHHHAQTQRRSTVASLLAQDYSPGKDELRPPPPPATRPHPTPTPKQHLHPDRRRHPRRGLLHQAPEPPPQTPARSRQATRQNRDPSRTGNAQLRGQRIHRKRPARTRPLKLVTTPRLLETKSNYSGVRDFARNRWPLGAVWPTRPVDPCGPVGTCVRVEPQREVSLESADDRPV